MAAGQQELTQDAVAQLTALLALQLKTETFFVEDPVSGGAWCVRLTIASASGMQTILTMNPTNARALAKALQQCALECATKLIPKAPNLVKL